MKYKDHSVVETGRRGLIPVQVGDLVMAARGLKASWRDPGGLCSGSAERQFRTRARCVGDDMDICKENEYRAKRASKRSFGATVYGGERLRRSGTARLGGCYQYAELCPLCWVGALVSDGRMCRRSRRWVQRDKLFQSYISGERSGAVNPHDSWSRGRRVVGTQSQASSHTMGIRVSLTKVLGIEAFFTGTKRTLNHGSSTLQGGSIQLELEAAGFA
ncbi:Hypothetical_protein [Hexamita inflata]|uniref:Hypothetical_protein n=1 Tax=Hexamita inflata TaxID=28002 RepID=A0AA86UZC3_9EUKA|nr:Hypothetical protein HINF_LOCUS61904 [Hexamita inflata]